jgi:anthranilate phosphoribosyltransferase
VKVLMIDNYDSFTYNLVHLLEELGADVVTVRNDTITPDEAVALAPDRLVVSPGPGRPADAGVSIEIIRRLGPTTRTLGVCLGHQAIVEAFGGEIGQAQALLHGKSSLVTHDGSGVFAGLPDEVADRGRRGDGRPSRDVPRRGRPVPPGERPHAARPDHGEELPHVITVAIATVADGRDLSRADARDVMRVVMSGEATPAQIGGLLIGLRAKGETVDEITGFAEAMAEHVVPVTPTRAPLVDIVGTGGDGAGTFNISTTAALVAAAAGAAVAKHGNRAASSVCGSADVLEALGIALEQSPERIAASIDEHGFGFMFARAHHPAMRFAAPVRQELGTRTVFNVLGPLANPAGARDGVFGVHSPALARTYAETLAGLGARRAFVVHGDGGLDELSPSGPNLVVEVVDGAIHDWELDPRSLGIYPTSPDELLGGSPADNADTLRRVLAGEPGGRRDAVVLNASGALVASGLADDIGEGVEVAAAAIDSGAATATLEQLIAFSNEVVV